MTSVPRSDDLDRLIDRHMALVEVHRRIASESRKEAGARDRPESGPQGPWITVSKSLGSGARRMAQKVADHLGWHLFDREILDAIARSTHTRQRILARLDERALGLLDDFFSSILVPGEPSQRDFLNHMMRVVWTLGKEGRAVLLGRGANWVLDPRYGLRVRVTAPVEHRVAALAKIESLTPDEARKRIHEDDGRRANFIRKVYGKEIDDPLGYDLVLNMACQEIETGVKTILAAFEHKIGA